MQLFFHPPTLANKFIVSPKRPFYGVDDDGRNGSSPLQAAWNLDPILQTFRHRTPRGHRCRPHVRSLYYFWQHFRLSQAQVQEAASTSLATLAIVDAPAWYKQRCCSIDPPSLESSRQQDAQIRSYQAPSQVRMEAQSHAQTHVP